MREIKFRARNANVPPCWIYGYFVIEDGYNYIINDEGKFKVIAGTEGQYIGLHDKNNKEIYEGDILATPDIPNVTVYWFEQGGRWNGKYIGKSKDCEINDSVFYTSEIIGNIYENPGLLKWKKI